MLKVVIIDDEKWSLDYMRELIDWRANGAEIVGEFNSTTEALRFLNDNGDVDLVLSDVEMPKMNGIEFLRKVGKNLPKTDFVFISNHDNFEYVREALRYRAIDYLLKPIDKKDILRILESVKASSEKMVENIAVKANVGVLFDDIQKSVADIWQTDTDGLTVCCVCDTMEEPTVNYLKDFFSSSDIYCYRSVFYNSFFIKTGRETLDKFLLHAHQNCVSRFGVYATDNPKEKLNNMLINAQNAFDGLWFCGDSSVCVYDKDCEGLLLNYVSIITKNLEVGAVKEAQSGVDDFIKQLRSKRAQGSVGVLFVNKLIEFLTLRFDYAQDMRDYMLIDVSHAKKRFQTVEKLIDFLHSIIYEYGSDTDNLQNLKAKDFVPLIKKYIENNYSGDINLTVLSKEFTISSKYLSSIFKKETGINLNRYINLVRIQRAEEMLLQTDISIQDISYLCGYGDSSYFIKVFREIVGKTPIEYRLNGV